jgi:hypothetical protein
MGGCVILPLLYFITWYERCGSDHKRTLLNKLVSALCWTCLEWYLLVQVREPGLPDFSGKTYQNGKMYAKVPKYTKL